MARSYRPLSFIGEATIVKLRGEPFPRKMPRSDIRRAAVDGLIIRCLGIITPIRLLRQNRTSKAGHCCERSARCRC